MRVLIAALLVGVASAASLAPLYKARDPVQNSYVVKFKDGQKSDRVIKELPTLRASMSRRYKAFNGIAIHAQAKYISALQRMPEVEYIEQDSIYRASVQWGIDRINQRKLPLDGQTNHYGEGYGTHIYIVDTGILYSHAEFTGRAHFFWDFENNDENIHKGEDCDGHGTHCAGIAAGLDVGIARQASLYSVRVLNCMGSGPFSVIIAGCDAIVESGSHPGVVSLSLGGSASNAQDEVIEKMMDAGFTVSIAAGNYNADACNLSPARVKRALTVGATNIFDDRAWYSNYGSCVDIFAPGTDIGSADYLNNFGYVFLSGTSMACPHVAGVAAIHLGKGVCNNHDGCKDKIIGDATTGVVGNLGADSPNRLLYCE